MSVAGDVAILEAERDDLARRLADRAAREVEARRLLYRRGYWAGRRAGERGAGAMTAPERLARAKTRQLIDPEAIG
jgi:hypothetical protein